MKLKIYFSLLLTFSSVSLWAQITLGVEDMPSKFQKYVIASMRAEGIKFDATSGTVDGSWDLSAVTYADSNLDTTILITPADTEYESEFPDANIVMDNSDIVMMAYKSENGIEWHGGILEEWDTTRILKFEDPFEYLKLPLKYENKHADEFQFEISNVINSNFSIVVEQNFKRNYNVNGYGSLKMGDGNTYDVLRIKVREIDSSVSTVKTPMGEQTMTNRNFSYYYEFWANGFGQPLARVEVDSADHSSLLYMEILDLQKTIVGQPEQVAQSGLVVYPNPASTSIRIMHDEEIDHVNFFDLSSRRLISSEPFTGTVDVSTFKKGFYLVEVIGKEGAVLGRQKCLID